MSTISAATHDDLGGEGAAGLAELMLSLGQAAELGGMAEQTLKKHLKDPTFPKFKGGSNGVPYEIPAVGFKAWLDAHAERIRAEEAERAAHLRQIGFSFADDEPPEMEGTVAKAVTAAEISALSTARLNLLRAQKEEGQLVPRAQMERMVGEACDALVKELAGLPMRLGRYLNLTRDQKAEVDAMIEQVRVNFARSLGAEVPAPAETAEAPGDELSPS